MRCLDLNNGGERGIRTLDTVTRVTPQQGAAFDHSATSPVNKNLLECVFYDENDEIAKTIMNLLSHTL